MRYDGKMKATGLKFHPDNQKACIAMLERWVNEIRNPATRQMQQPTVQGVLTLHEAVKRFEQAKYPLLGHAAAKNYERAFAYFVGPDLALEYQILYDDIVARNQAAVSGPVGVRLAQNTWRKYLTSYLTFFDFVVENEWLRRNPITSIGIPKKQQKLDVLVYSREDVAAICKQVRLTENHEDYALLYEL